MLTSGSYRSSQACAHCRELLIANADHPIRRSSIQSPDEAAAWNGRRESIGVLNGSRKRSRPTQSSPVCRDLAVLGRNMGQPRGDSRDSGRPSIVRQLECT